MTESRCERGEAGGGRRGERERAWDSPTFVVVFCRISDEGHALSGERHGPLSIIGYICGLPESETNHQVYGSVVPPSEHLFLGRLEFIYPKGHAGRGGAR